MSAGSGPEKFQELVEAVLSDRAGDAERERLAEWIERDPGLRAEFLRRSEIYHLLPLALEEEHDAERFLDSIRARLQAKGDSQVFLAATRQRILRAGASRRRTGWVAAGIAAAALVAAAIWVTVGSEPAPRPPRNRVAEKEAPDPVRPKPAPFVERETPPEPPAKIEPRREERRIVAPETPPPPSRPAPRTEPVPEPPRTPAKAPAVAQKTGKPREAPRPKPQNLPSPYFGTIEKSRGKVEILAGPMRKAAAQGKRVFRRRGIQTGDGRSSAVVRYPDGTELDLAPNTVIWDVSDRPTSPEEPSKRILVAQGEVLAAVSKQPSARPMVLVTPQGEVEVLGTIFRLQVSDGSTRLEMGEGRVRLTRKEDGKSVEVAAGFGAEIAEGKPFAAHPLRTAFYGTPSGKPKR